MKDSIDFDFEFFEKCETIADYMEGHLYDTVHWQLPSPASPYDPDHEEDVDRYNEMHSKAMAQVITIMATRLSDLADEMQDYHEYKLNTK